MTVAAYVSEDPAVDPWVHGLACGFVFNHPSGFADPLTGELTKVLLDCL